MEKMMEWFCFFRIFAYYSDSLKMTKIMTPNQNVAPFSSFPKKVPVNAPVNSSVNAPVDSSVNPASSFLSQQAKRNLELGKINRNIFNGPTVL